MKYDLENKDEYDKFYYDSEQMMKDKSRVELKTIREHRSLSQNAYLHVCISMYAIHFGSTLNEAKTDLKRACHFMVYEKKGKKYLKETSKMDSKQLTSFIEWIRNYASGNGCYIPSSEEYLIDKYRIDNEIERHKEYL